jgi:23S rRNA pseudouridine2605 synthase
LTAERVQKVLARLGHGSRRGIEAAMRAGRVTVNGKPVSPGDAVSAGDVVTFDGKRIIIDDAPAVESRVLIYHKPEGEICTRADPEGRPNIFTKLPRVNQGRWVAIGRLDINTTGLILLTTDGELANRLMHPSSEIEREYLVRVLGEVTPEVVAQMKQGIELEDGLARFSTVYEVGGRGVNHWYGVVLKEGRKREVRRLWEAAGFRVSRLKRIRFGPVSLPARVRQGKFLELEAAAVAAVAPARRTPPNPPVAPPKKKRR